MSSLLRLLSGVIGGAGDVDATVVWEDAVGDGTDASSYTISVDIGDAADRKLVAGFICNHSVSAQTISAGPTLDGETMTVEFFQADGINIGHVGFAYIDNSSINGIVDFTITFSSGMTRCHVAIWSVFGAATGGASATDYDISSPHDLSLNVTAGSVCIGCAHTGAGTATWSGDLGTEDFEVSVDGIIISGASAALESADTPLTASVTGNNAIAGAVTYDKA